MRAFSIDECRVQAVDETSSVERRKIYAVNDDDKDVSSNSAARFQIVKPNGVIVKDHLPDIVTANRAARALGVNVSVFRVDQEKRVAMSHQGPGGWWPSKRTLQSLEDYEP